MSIRTTAILALVLGAMACSKQQPAECPTCPQCPVVEVKTEEPKQPEGKAENNPEESIPEECNLYHIVDQYEAVQFDHSSHEGYADNCETCHHHASGVEHTPPCRECHGKVSGDLRKPGLKGAYHRQCMNCHREMEAGPMGCEECHPKREGAEPLEKQKLALEAVPEKMRLGHLADEYGGVDFAHKVHVQVTDGCATCHHHSNGVEVAPPCRACHDTPQKLKNAYHEQCLGCHQSVVKVRQEKLSELKIERAEAHQRGNEKKARAYGLKLEMIMESGGSPLNCKDCHIPKKSPKTVSLNHIKEDKGPVEFDHEAHLNTAQFCTDCHHSHKGFNSFTSCRTCHGPGQAAAEKVGLEDAYHQQCISCHEKDEQGPTECGDCHTD